MALSAAYVGFLALCLAAPSPEDLEKELGRLEGTWKFTSIQADGTKLADDVVRGARLRIAGKRFTFRVDKELHDGIINVDPTQKPKTIDVTFTSGIDKGKSALGIYELSGDQFRVCIGIVGKERPKEFKSTPKSGHVLEMMIRDKP